MNWNTWSSTHPKAVQVTLKIYFELCVYVEVYVPVHSCCCRPEEHVSSSGAGATGVCEPPDVGPKNQTQVLWKDSRYFYLLSHLPRYHPAHFDVSLCTQKKMKLFG